MSHESMIKTSMTEALGRFLDVDVARYKLVSTNLANVDTPGYSRQVPILETGDPIVLDPLTFGTGVRLRTIESIRNPILESQIQQETQTQGELSALVSALAQTQSNFTSTAGDIGTAISKFFDSINQLSTSPSDLSLRRNVLTAAGNVATAFNLASGHLIAQRTNLGQGIEQAVGEINQLTQQIAQLNGQIAILENAGENAGTFLDQRTQLVDRLSSLIDVSVIPSDNTITLTTASGTALVAGQQSFALSTGSDVSGVQHIFAQNNDITTTIISGQLGGILAARDQQIPGIANQLDILAAGLANAVNQVQTSGYDLNGNPTTGVNLFNPPPAPVAGAAATLTLAISDPALIAASADGTTGSNGNAEAMYALRKQALIAGQSAAEYYSTIVFNIGNSVANSTAQQEASSLVLQQLNNQRSAVSGVSLDEEAANLMRFQQAYAASAKVIAAISSLMEVVINMKR